MASDCLCSVLRLNEDSTICMLVSKIFISCQNELLACHQASCTVGIYIHFDIVYLASPVKRAICFLSVIRSIHLEGGTVLSRVL